MRILDSHFHIWDLSALKLSWLDDYEALKKDFLMQDYLKECQKNAIEKGIYIEVDSDDKNDENEYVAKINNEHLCAVILSVNLSKSMSLPKNENLRGIREVLHTKNVRDKRALEQSFKEGLCVLKDANLIFECCINMSNLDEFYESAKETNAKFVLDHLGNPALSDGFLKSFEFIKYKKDMQNLANLQNSSCKLSGFDIKKMSHKDNVYLLDFMLDIFGEKRLCYGSNYPVCNLATPMSEWIEFLKNNLKEEFLEDIFYKNAVEIYSLREQK